MYATQKKILSLKIKMVK